MPQKLFYRALVASKKSRRRALKPRAPKAEPQPEPKLEETKSKPNHHERLLGFGRNVRALRTALGLSLEKLAEDAGVSVNQLAAIERGEKKPRESTFRAIVAALRVAPDVLLDGPFRGKEGLSVPSRAFRDLFDRASPEFQEHALRRLHDELAKQRDEK